MDACSDPLIEQVVVMSAAQVGKTEVINNLIGFYVDQDPAPILVVMPTLEMARSWSTDRLAPMLMESPRLSGKVEEPRTRDSGNTILHKRFPGGHLTVVGANSASGLSSRPIRVVLCDEVDRYPPSAGTEGDAIALAYRRTATFWNRKLILTSTPSIKGLSRIEQAWLQSDQRRFHVPCPACHADQLLSWGAPDAPFGLKWESGRPETAAYLCAACGVLIDEADKYGMLAAGRWVAGVIGQQRIAGFHLNALYSPWTRWADLARQFLEAKPYRETLKTFVNTVFGEPWEEEGEQLNPASLTDRREEYRAIVPAGVALLTAGVDVQGDRLEVLVNGWGQGEESWRIHYEQLFGDPGREDVWQRLDHVLANSYKHETGADIRIRSACIDAMGGHTEMVYRFTAARKARNIWAVRGATKPGQALLGRPSKPNKFGAKLLPIGTETGKDILFSRLRILQAGPGYLHFPHWLDAEYFAQLTAEKAITRYVKGRPVRSYEKTRPRNEALDLEVYALAALALLGTGTRNRLGTLAAGIAPPKPPPDESGPASAASIIRRVPPRGGGWVNRWR